MIGRRVTLLLFAAVMVIVAQEPGDELRVTIQKRGQAVIVDVRASDVSLYALLARIGERTGSRLHVAPELLARVRAATVSVAVDGALLSDLVGDLAASEGLGHQVHQESIRIVTSPAPGNDGYVAELGARALSAIEHALVGSDVQDAAEHVLNAGLIHYALGDLEAALLRFRIFFQEHTTHARAAEARMLAGWCALQEGSYDEAITILSAIDDAAHSAEAVLQGQLLQARILRRQGNLPEVLVRLDRVIDVTKILQTRGIALILKAEALYEAGLADEALKTLLRFDTDLQRKLPDLAARLPLFNGICLLGAGSPGDAVKHLQLASLIEEDDHRRARAAIELVRCYLAVDDPLTASLAVRSALKLVREGPLATEALMLQAEVYTLLGMRELALASYERVLQRRAEPDATTRTALRGMAELLFEERRYAEARELFRWLSGTPQAGPEIGLMVARCAIGEKNWARAIELLDGLDDESLDDTLRGEIAGLRARCYLAQGDYAKASLAFQGWREDR